MRNILAALLFAPGLAAAVCFQHPDTGSTYCAEASECPAGTTWSPSQLCRAATAPPACTGVDSGSYLPEAEPITSFQVLAAARADWIRVGAVVQVSGAVRMAATSAPAQVLLNPPVPTVFTAVTDLSGIVSAMNRPYSGVVVAEKEGRQARIMYAPSEHFLETLLYAYTYRIMECP